jgi:pimeloyl-ACP methyl ester carboxylesterase
MTLERRFDRCRASFTSSSGSSMSKRSFVSSLAAVAAVAGLVWASACRASPSESQEAELALEPCQLQAPGIPARLAARCGEWSVPEDRGQPQGRRISLRVAVVPAVSRHPEPDPLVFLTGGPGQAATESYVTLHPAFRRVNRDRDILLVDQRGTGRSNALRCPESEAKDIALLDESAIRPWVARCLEALDADPRFYTTTIAMTDLDEIRKALGYRQVNLYGLSYGTRAALTYLRMFPDRVRTVILDGVVPPSEVLGLDVARDAQRSLDLLIARCEAEPVCRERFPDLEGDLDALMARLEPPPSLVLRHPRTGEEESLSFTREMAAYAIRILSYSQETQSLIPLILSSASQGDLDTLAAQFLITTAAVGETMADGMGISVVCSEDYPFFEPEAIEKRSRNTYLGTLQTDSLELVCPLWPRGEVPKDFKEPVHADVPVLLLSGEADPVTPPENGELVAEALPRALHLVAKGQGHVVIHRGCIPLLASTFLETGSFEGLDVSCVDDIAPQAFFTAFTGPTP